MSSVSSMDEYRERGLVRVMMRLDGNNAMDGCYVGIATCTVLNDTWWGGRDDVCMRHDDMYTCVAFHSLATAVSGSTLLINASSCHHSEGIDVLRLPGRTVTKR